MKILKIQEQMYQKIKDIWISSNPLRCGEIIIEAGMVKAFWWIIQEDEKEKQEHTTFIAMDHDDEDNDHDEDDFVDDHGHDDHDDDDFQS